MNSLVSEYLRSTLEGERLLREPMGASCLATILFPVNNEPIRRVLDLLESITEQEEIDFNKIEVLCLVGNSVYDGSASSERIMRANELVLELPVWRNAHGLNGQRFSEETRSRASKIREQFNAYVIDKSTVGLAMSECNVGRARNRLLGEAVQRFSRQEKNGVLIMTDADIVFSNPRYIRSILDIFNSQEHLIAGTGGVDYVFDPDTLNEKQRKSIHDAFSEYILIRRWRCLSEHLLGKPVNLSPPDACFGGSIFCLSEAAAECGGFRPLGRCEDSYFFKDISAYAARKGNIASSLPNLRVTEALRDSFRTDASLGYSLAKQKGLPLVKHPITGKSAHLSEKMFQDLSAIAAETEQGRAFVRRLESLPRILYTDAFPQ